MSRLVGFKHTEETKVKISNAHKGKQYFLGHKHTEETKRKMRECHLGAKNPMWLGDKVGYVALHNWVRRRISKPARCVLCNEREAFDLCNISGEYKRDLADWRWLCRKCHMRLDDRLRKLSTYMIGNTNYIGRRRKQNGQFI